MPRAAKARIALQKARRPSTSSATVGSSGIRRSGSLTSATGEASSLGLAAGELLRAEPGGVLQPGQLEHLLDVQGVRVEREAIIPTSSRTDRSRIRAPVWSIAPILPASIASRGVLPEHRHAARVRPDQAEDHVDCGRLARAVRSEQGDRLATLDHQVDAPHRVHRTAGTVPGLHKAPQADPRVLAVGTVHAEVLIAGLERHLSYTLRVARRSRGREAVWRSRGGLAVARRSRCGRDRLLLACWSAPRPRAPQGTSTILPRV